MENCRVCAILLAGGSGSRMNLGITKQQLSLKGKTMLYRALSAFEACESVTDIILVVRDDELTFAENEAGENFTKLRHIAVGGSTRAKSAKNGFVSIDFPCDFVAVHDVARCLITPDMITKVVLDAEKFGAASASSVVVDTVKRIDNNGFVLATENREELRMAATPQIFKYELYLRAMSEINIEEANITDDNMLMELLGIPVYMTDIDGVNIKVTHAKDIPYAEYFLGENDV